MSHPSPAWQALLAHREALSAARIEDLFASDPRRGAALTVRCGGLALDLSKQHLTAETLRTDLIDLWGFGFIQGFKNVGQPNMEIPYAVRPQLLTAAATACAKTPDLAFVDLMDQLAAKVKLK